MSERCLGFEGQPACEQVDQTQPKEAQPVELTEAEKLQRFVANVSKVALGFVSEEIRRLRHGA